MNLYTHAVPCRQRVCHSAVALVQLKRSRRTCEDGGLYFDVHKPNIAFINVQHPASGVARMMQITAVPEAESNAMMRVGVGLIGWRLRHKARRRPMRRLFR